MEPPVSNIYTHYELYNTNYTLVASGATIVASASVCHKNMAVTKVM